MGRSILCTAAISMVVLASAGCREVIDATASNSPVVTVDVMEVRARRVNDTIELVGRTEPWREATLYFEVSGIVEKVFVEEGEVVNLGDPIAQLEKIDYELAKTRSQAELDTASADLDLLKAGTRKEDLEAAQADFTAAEATAKFWSSELTRVLVLYRSKAITDSERDRVRQQNDAAQQQQRAAKARLDRAIAGPRTEEIDAAEARVRAAQQSLALAERELAKATVKSPFAGRLERRRVDPGAYINVFPQGGVPIVHLVDVSSIDAVIAVPEVMVKQIDAHQMITIAPAMDPTQSAVGKVIAVSSVADSASGTYQLRVRIGNRDGRFLGGMVVTAHIPIDNASPRIRVPFGAVGHAYGNEHFVYVVNDDNTVLARNVDLGPITDDEIEIVGGLGQGETIVTSSLELIVSGDQIRISAPETDGPSP